jgi:mono/diheme cytochrome c family protein/plastocyanin
MHRERIAAVLVLLPMTAMVAAIVWFGWASDRVFGARDTVEFDLTGVASAGVWAQGPVNGLNYWWRSFEPATLYVTEGDEVVINLRSADVFHRFYLPAFSVGPVAIEPGHTVTVRFKAERHGVFQYYCTSMCGGCHFYMRGWIVVSKKGEIPVQPPPIMCTLCRPEDLPRPETASLVDQGAYLYLEKGCVTCHGPEGQGGIGNDNSANSPVPAHNTTAEKLFIGSPEDADEFIRLLDENADLGALEEPPEIERFQVVRTRYENAKEIVRKGRYSSKVDPAGPEPPLQMPAWQHIVREREIDALLVYFVSLYPWEEG